jgi:hypothetical protein
MGGGSLIEILLVDGIVNRGTTILVLVLERVEAQWSSVAFTERSSYM